jgi:hypothetical protein
MVDPVADPSSDEPNLLGDVPRQLVRLVEFSVFAELAETRFLNRPAFLGADPAARSDHYAAAGLARDFPVGGVRHLQPTISFARAKDAPKRKRAFRLAEIELQFSF